MHKIDSPHANGSNEFTDGDPGTGIEATEVWSKWLNTAQRELVAVVEGAGITLDDQNDGQLLEAIQALLAASGVVGSVIWTAKSSAPAGYLKCNGAAVSRTTYADLFAEIGTVFGVGDGSTTFNLPDLRGEFIRGWDDSRGVDSGRTFGSSQSDLLKSHNHIKATAWANGGASHYPDYWAGITGSVYSSTHYTGSTGGSETRPRNVAMMACIKY